MKKAKRETITTAMALPKTMKLVAVYPNVIGDTLDVVGILFDKHGVPSGYVCSGFGHPMSFTGEDYMEILETFEVETDLTKFNMQQSLKHNEEQIKALKKGKLTEDVKSQINFLMGFNKHLRKYLPKAKAGLQ